MATSKISPVFRDRLSQLGCDDLTRIILMLQAAPPRSAAHRLTAPERQQVLVATRISAEAVFSQIDAIFSEFGGRRLSNAASGLGTIVAEATPAAIAALSTLEQVEAIIEDQHVTGLDLRRS